MDTSKAFGLATIWVFGTATPAFIVGFGWMIFAEIEETGLSSSSDYTHHPNVLM